ncbi:MAG TPA: ABC transporter substrate-binding protein [Desulfobacteraceae bacterium]|nr:ABC transporter substrate-binding protein [Desulfobacteraceae bacterium]
MKKLLFAIIVVWASAALADETFPKPGWADKPNPIAGKSAQPGGEFSIFAGQYPKSLNYYLDNNTLSAEIFGAMYETLLTLNPLTADYDPGLAEKWTISDDKKTFTFYIDKRAKWSDGSPITAEDVKWTYRAILDPKNITGPHKLEMERFQSAEIVDTHTIRFRAKDVHWKNLGAAGSFHILPKKAFDGKDFNKINFDFPVISGSYRRGDIQEGIFINLERRDDWWGRALKRYQGIGNFKTLKFKFFAEQENAFEAFKKGLLDIFPVYMARIWINETGGDKFASNLIIKQKVYNHKPVGFQGFAMNMRKPPFNDVRVRKAMTLLLDREKMNNTLMYGQYFLHRSYFEDLYNKANPCPNPLISMDKEKARALLKEAGWTVNSKTGLLEKDGKRFSFKFLTHDSSSEKFVAIYAEDLKDAGIELTVDKKDWAAWAKDMQNFDYQMTWAAWSSVIFKDPESMWSSKEAERKSGNNITGFKHPRVDELIEKQRAVFDMSERNKICREIDKIVYEDYPYVLLWNINYVRLLYWNKFGTPDTVLDKYGDERGAYWYWWIDPDSEADMKDAVKKNTPLPAKPPSVHFDEVFK